VFFEHLWPDVPCQRVAINSGNARATQMILVINIFLLPSLSRRKGARSGGALGFRCGLKPLAVIFGDASPVGGRHYRFAGPVHARDQMKDAAALAVRSSSQFDSNGI
jgi:hypothetical protein